MAQFYRDEIIAGKIKVGDRDSYIELKQMKRLENLEVAPDETNFNALLHELKSAGLMKSLPGGVTITVTDGDSVAVKDATVTLTDVEGEVIFAVGVTDVDGICEFENVPVGEYGATVIHGGLGDTETFSVLDSTVTEQTLVLAEIV